MRVSSSRNHDNKALPGSLQSSYASYSSLGGEEVRVESASTYDLSLVNYLRRSFKCDMWRNSRCDTTRLAGL